MAKTGNRFRLWRHSCFGALLFGVLLANGFSPAAKICAAEFNLNNPAVVVRRTQFCTSCRMELDVTDLPAGATFACPACHAKQLRLPDRFLRLQVLQQCPGCKTLMDVHDRKPGTLIRCAVCGMVQPVLAAATAKPEEFRKGGKIITPDEIVTTADLSAKPRSLAEVSVAALVNDEPVSSAEVERRLLLLIEEKKAGMGSRADTPEGREALAQQMPALKREALQVLIDEALLLQQSRKDGIVISPRHLDKEEEKYLRTSGRDKLDDDTRRRLQENLVFREMLEAHTSARQPAVKEIRAYYQEHLEQFRAPARIRLRLLTVFKDRAGRKDPRPAGVIIDEAGKAVRAHRDFYAAASTTSEDFFAPDGGLFSLEGEDLVPLKAFALPVQKALQDKAEGEIVGPIELSNALVLAFIEELRPASTQPLPQVQAKISAILTHRKRIEDFDNYIQGLRKKASIVIY